MFFTLPILLIPLNMHLEFAAVFPNAAAIMNPSASLIGLVFQSLVFNLYKVIQNAEICELNKKRKKLRHDAAR